MVAKTAEKPQKAAAKKDGTILAIDLGGTKILSAVINHENKILGQGKRATPFASSEQTITEAIIGTAEDALKASNVSAKAISCIGMGSPGPLNPETGVVIRTGNINVKNYAIGDILTKHFGVPVTMDNDVHMGVFAEFKIGAGKGTRNLIGLWIGTGVGGCVIRDGQVVWGANRNAGEIGHVILDARRRIKDKKRGTLETESSKTGMTEFIKRRIKKGEKTSLKKYVKGKEDRLKSGALVKAFNKGDKVAVAAIEHSALYCGIAVANLFNAFSPELFILGGGVVATLGQPYLDLVLKSANEYVYSTDLAPIRLALAQLGDDSGIMGAALAAREKFL